MDCDHPENKLRVGPRVPMRYGSAYTQHCECGAWRTLLHVPGAWQPKEMFEAALAATNDDP